VLKPWKDMFHENEATLNALGAKLVFAGTKKKMTVSLQLYLILSPPKLWKRLEATRNLKLNEQQLALCWKPRW